MTKKELLLASFSAVAALTLTACSDDSSGSTPASNSDNQSATSEVSDTPTEIAAKGSENTSDNGTSRVATALAGKVPAMAKVQPMLDAKAQLHTTFEAVEAAKKSGSYNDLMAAYDAQLNAYNKIVTDRLVEEASTAFSEYMSSTQGGKTDGVANTQAADLALMSDTIAQFKGFMDKQKTNANNAGLFGKKSLPTVIAGERTRYEEALVEISADPISESFGSKLARTVGKHVASNSREIAPVLGNKNVYWRNDKADNAAVRAALKDQTDKIKAAAIDAVAASVYAAMKDKFVLKYNDDTSGSLSISTEQNYTLAELRSIVSLSNLKGKIPSLNNKYAPNFSGSTFAEGAKPTEADLNAVQAGLDSNVPGYVKNFLATDNVSKIFFPTAASTVGNTKKLSAGLVGQLAKISLRDARRGGFGIDATNFALNGASGEKVALSAPLYVKLDGSVEAGKSFNATGTVATKLTDTVVAVTHATANTGVGFTADSSHAETSVAISQNFGAAFAEVQFGSVDAKGVNKADFSGTSTQITLGYDTAHVTPFVQLQVRDITRSEFLDANVAHTTVALGAEVAVANHAADTYAVSANLTAKAGYETKSWTSLDRHLGTDAGFSGSLDFTGSLKLNSGVSFTSNLGFGSVAGASAGLNMSVSR